ncbi:MAG TPA: hypothetical protein VIJ95_11610 [Hanamia sp.]
MKRKFKIFVCLLAFLICFTNNGYAQTNDTLNPPDDRIESPSNQKDSFKDLNDTANLSLDDSDKIMRWRHSREFAYIHYLDSLLREQKNIRADTVSINENSGKIIRKHKSENQISAFNKILNSLPLKIFFWILALIFIGFTGYKVLFKNGIFSAKKNKSIEESGEDFSADLDDISKYDVLISEAEKRYDYNLAIRYFFLKTLKTLSERGLISFVPDKTNQEYLSEMRSNNYFEEFQSLTRNYEYLWYGKFLIEEKNYLLLKEKFILFNKKV